MIIYQTAIKLISLDTVINMRMAVFSNRHLKPMQAILNLKHKVARITIIVKEPMIIQVALFIVGTSKRISPYSNEEE